MPISPKELQPLVLARNKPTKERVKLLETEIDAIIKAKAPKPGESVQCRLPLGEPDGVIASLVKDYEAAKWRVDISKRGISGAITGKGDYMPTYPEGIYRVLTFTYTEL